MGEKERAVGSEIFTAFYSEARYSRSGNQWSNVCSCSMRIADAFACLKLIY